MDSMRNMQQNLEPWEPPKNLLVTESPSLFKIVKFNFLVWVLFKVKHFGYHITWFYREINHIPDKEREPMFVEIIFCVVSFLLLI
jgi:hypothetical protein